MHVPLLARTRLPTFYLNRCIIFLSRKIKHVKIIHVKFKTSHLQHVYFTFGISRQSYSLKATGYMGFNLSKHDEAVNKIFKLLSTGDDDDDDDDEPTKEQCKKYITQACPKAEKGKSPF